MPQDLTALYHYTNIRGLKGIIESSCLHATNVRYLNDSQEFIFGIEYFSKLFPSPEVAFSAQEHEDSLYDNLIDRLFVLLLEDFKHGKNVSEDYFVISFSTKPDVLSQWRGYGKDNAGYCIKFNYPKILYPANSLMSTPIQKINYIDSKDLSFARNRLNQIKNIWKPDFDQRMPWLKRHDIAEYMKMLARFDELESAAGPSVRIPTSTDRVCYPDKVDANDDPGWYQLINEFIFFAVEPALSNIACAWKHNAFSEEDEYRLVYKKFELESHPDHMNIKFKEGKNFLVPYVEVPYDFKKNKIIEEVIVGPCPHPVEAAASARQFLAAYLEDVAEVVNSKIPYRFW